MIVQDTMQYLSQLDPEVGASVQEEFARQQRNIELIASENIVSPAVMVAMGTCLTNKYAEGYPGHRYYGGCFAVDVTEELARQRPASYSAASMPMFSPTPVLTPIWRPSSRWRSRGTPFWA